MNLSLLRLFTVPIYLFLSAKYVFPRLHARIEERNTYLFEGNTQREPSIDNDFDPALYF